MKNPDKIELIISPKQRKDVLDIVDKLEDLNEKTVSRLKNMTVKDDGYQIILQDEELEDLCDSLAEAIHNEEDDKTLKKLERVSDFFEDILADYIDETDDLDEEEEEEDEDEDEEDEEEDEDEEDEEEDEDHK